MKFTTRITFIHYDELDTTHCTVFDITTEAAKKTDAEKAALTVFVKKAKEYSSPGESKIVGTEEGEEFSTPPVLYCTSGQTHARLSS